MRNYQARQKSGGKIYSHEGGGILGLRRGLFGSGGPLFEMLLALSIIAVVVMMVVPLTPWLLDLLISVNLGASVLMIALALFVRNPLSFNAFPTLLLIATLYRLALNISSTRLILLRADAGRVIEGFGGVVVGGDIIVGAVIFGILAMVLFLVITKGAERVAEVAARFTLDALPGMQLAIDSDVRNGALSSAEASRQRAKLDSTSRYYGSLDGAMKFVRGDALAGLVIICVNIIGGLAIGIGRRGMSLEQALDTYTRLTIGDGLVTLLPALFISTAAGLLVTRVGQGGDGRRLGQQLGLQMFAEPRALAAAALCLIILSVIPGLPFWPFVLLGGLMGIVSLFQFRAERRRNLLAGESDSLPLDEDAVVPSAVIEVGDSLYSVLSSNVRDRGGWRSVMSNVTAPLRRDLGLPIGVIPIVSSNGADRRGDQAILKIRGVSQMPLMVLADPAARDKTGILETFIERAQEELIKKADKILGLDEVQLLVDTLARQRPVLVRETVPQVVKLPVLTTLLRQLLRDKISLDHLPEILEIIAKSQLFGSSDDLLGIVRKGLRTTITNQLLGDDNSIEAATLSLDVESVLETSLSKTSEGSRLVLSPDVVAQLVDVCNQTFKDSTRPVLVTKPGLRKPVADLFAKDLPELTVVSAGELESGVRVEVVGEVGV